ncbi:UbiA family prenyltransferase [Saccharopolyspora gloriosae]|uniref:4-hydroxybenzoate polyprenyltransferase n=1 Tax=Saccharopolyspora gloriosae TaxID=455344 RepID=A0A840NIP4_9PSEU|nr:UbiA family prenyltransferase [Saccharopolyspora gloriosae]MBB5070168.1 4-hydroxybenzoate polyprenyltransferase [Saccharopolyspora gloriosae]
MIRLATLISLTRAPAALTVLGDTAVGAAAAGRRLGGRRALLPAASVALYWAGMALNDWADRELDAVERPERPIPSGQVGAGAAAGVAALLAGCGVAAGAAAGTAEAGLVAGLAAAVVGYDVVFKDGAAGPAAMAACRGLDVLLGAGGARAAWPAAAVLAAHTCSVTALSRGEVRGADPRTAAAALATTALAAVAAASGRCASHRHRVAAVTAAGLYAAQVGAAQLRAYRSPDARTVRAATRDGIHGMVALQLALTARHDLGAATVLAAIPPAVRSLGRTVSAT